MRCVLTFLFTLPLAAMEALSFAVCGPDATTTQVVRVIDDTALPSLRYRDGDGPWTTVELATRTLPGTSLVISEGFAESLTPGNVIAWDDGITVLGSWRTLRATLPLRIATGGDMMHEPELLAATCRAIIAENPEVAIIGGDWAYDNAEPGNVSRWPALLGTWAATMRRADGTGVPFVPVIGNHEIKATYEGTAFAALFPEPTTRIQDLGPEVSLLVLNTGHPTPIADQAAFVKTSLEARKDRTWRFACYHVPGYPSVRKMEEKGSVQVRTHWVPAFEAGGLAAAFENHDHARKRTFPLIGGVATAGGVVYLGDGAWGVKTRSLAADRPWIAASGSEHHAWIIDIGEKDAVARAIGPKGELDRTVLTPR
jgi:hypothetical protein